MEPAAAKQFLISRIIEEADFEHVDLLDAEKKMLAFSEAAPETAAILPEFERQYSDSEAYETKIVALVKRAHARDLQQSSQYKDTWSEAISALKDDDHYVLVFVYMAFPKYQSAIRPSRSLRNFLIYLSIGLALLFGGMILVVAWWSYQ